MPDWRHFIRGHLAPLTLGAERELEIIEELSQHIEAAYEDALRDGASEHDPNNNWKFYFEEVNATATSLMSAEGKVETIEPPDR